jgi:hypothetical protein
MGTTPFIALVKVKAEIAILCLGFPELPMFMHCRTWLVFDHLNGGPGKHPGIKKRLLRRQITGKDVNTLKSFLWPSAISFARPPQFSAQNEQGG